MSQGLALVPVKDLKSMDSENVVGGVEGGAAMSKQGLVRSSQTRLTKRTIQVKVLLNEEELEQLDWLVERMGSDRASVMRYLLSNVPRVERSKDNESLPNNKGHENEVIRINVGEIPGPWLKKKPQIRLFDPRHFDHIPQAVKAIRDGEAVVLNLTMMEPAQAQRAVDFLAGGSFYGEGHQERVGESVFLFASREYDVTTLEVLKDVSGSDPDKIKALKEIKIGDDSPNLDVGDGEIAGED